MRTTSVFVCLVVCASFCFAYDVVLKSGKVVHGTLVSQDDQMIMLQDASGVRMEFKKTSVDLEKTSAANTTATNPPASVTPASPSNPVPPAPRSPARTITEEDLKKLHDKYDLGAGMTKETADEPSESAETETPVTERTEEEWKSELQQLQAQLKAAQQDYTQSQSLCDQLQNATIQTHRLTDEKGNTMDMAQAKEEVCARADKAKGILDGVKDKYQSFLSEAKQQNIPPGWLRGEEGSDPTTDDSQH